MPIRALLIQIEESLRLYADHRSELLRECRAEIERLRAALVKHGRHSRDCDKTIYGEDSGVIIECTCGLDDALEAAPPAETSEPQ
jgi:hypothetical protein